MNNVQIGFSSSSALISRVIRWFTNGTVSHTFVTFEDSAGKTYVLEEAWNGCQCVALEEWLKENQGAVHATYLLPENVCSQKALIVATESYAKKYEGSNYGYGAMLGMAAVMAARWFKKKASNPFVSSKSLFCSEMVCMILQGANAQGTQSYTPSQTTPEDLYMWCLSVEGAGVANGH